MSGKPQPPKQFCKRGHPLTMDNLVVSVLKRQRRCRLCANALARKYKAAKRRKIGAYVKGQKPICANGHLRTKENLRPGRDDCAICHANQERERKRRAGAKPKVVLTREQKLAARRKWESTRKARKYSAFVETVNPLRVYDLGNGACGICSQPVAKNKFEVDHIVPLARGGEHSYKNTQPAHPTCNRKKWANTGVVI